MLKLPAFLIATTLAGSLGGGAADVANLNSTYGQTKSSNYEIVQNVISKGNINVQEIFKKNGIKVIIGSNCIINKPGGNKPEVDKPETEKPEKPNPDKPNKPTPEEPGDDKPEAENPGTDSSHADQVVKLVNKERKKAGLTELKVIKKITNAANVRAKEIVTSFSHTRPNGSKFSTALTENGAKFNGAGENIAWGQKTPEEVMKGWMNSKGHRDNILNKRYTSIGVGYYTKEGRTYWTQLFTF